MRVPSLIVREQLQQLGWPGALGVLLLMLAATWATLVWLPQQQALQALEQQVQRGQAYAARIEQGSELPPEVPGRQLADFHRTLPAQLDATATIKRIYATAQREQITLARGEYALGVDPKTRLGRYQILLPVSGSYPQLRRFLDSVLTEVPALVLEDVELQRKTIGETQLQGRLRMTLYLSRW